MGNNFPIQIESVVDSGWKDFTPGWEVSFMYTIDCFSPWEKYLPIIRTRNIIKTYNTQLTPISAQFIQQKSSYFDERWKPANFTYSLETLKEQYHVFLPLFFELDDPTWALVSSSKAILNLLRICQDSHIWFSFCPMVHSGELFYS